MHLIFERSKGLFKSNCNILALAWMPYYDESSFRQELFDYHQKQLVKLTSSIASNNSTQNNNNSNSNNNNNQVGHLARAHQNARLQNQNNSINNNSNNRGNSNLWQSNDAQNNNCRTNQQKEKQAVPEFANSRLEELYNRYLAIRQIDSNDEQVTDDPNKRGLNVKQQLPNIQSINDELCLKYGSNSNFGWLAIGNVGKFVGVTLTSLLAPPIEEANLYNKKSKEQKNACDEDLMQFNNVDIETNYNNNHLVVQSDQIFDSNRNDASTLTFTNKSDRPDKYSNRTNFNLRGHLDEIILVKWNDLYQKLATIDSKGNVIIWSKINQKFTIQTPFYNRTKSVADFKWSNDGKTALICYTDSFILVGSYSGQRHWHSMLNLDDYHITCASWTPNDEQLLLGVSNGNVVVIDLLRSELTELVVNQCNIRTMCWSSCDISLKDINQKQFENQQQFFSHNNIFSNGRRNSNFRRGSSNIVNQRRLSRDCSVFSRYRLCSQGVPNDNSSSNNNNDNDNQRQSQEAFDSRNIENDNLKYSSSSIESNILAIDFANNSIKLYDGGLNDPEPKVIQVNQESYIMHWSNNGQILAVAGFTIHTSAPSIGFLKCRYLNTIKFYDQKGQLIHEKAINYTRYPITAFTWAHNDKRLFLATGPKLHCAKVFFGVPSLNLLATSCLYNNTKLLTKINLLENIVENCRANKTVLNWQSLNCPIDIYKESNIKNKKNQQQQIEHNQLLLINHQSGYSMSTDRTDLEQTINYHSTWNNSNVQKYKLPPKLQIKIDELFSQTIKQPYDERWTPSDIVWHVPKNEQRYYCTLICYTGYKDVNSNGYQYRSDYVTTGINDIYRIFVLYVEFQGSLIPILRARRVGFTETEYIIFDPEDHDQGKLAQRQQQKKVSDISQQLSKLFVNSDYQKQQQQQQHKFLTEQTMAQQLLLQANNMHNNNSTTPFYHNDAFAENCSDLHLYSEPRASSSAASLGRQSMSDAEHYYNFDNPNDRHMSSTTSSFNNNQTDALVDGRSHRQQEPMLLPMSSNQYLFHVLAMNQPAGSTRQQISNLNNQTNNKTYMSLINNSKIIKRNDDHKTNSHGLSSILNENHELARVKSNFRGTKFKLINVGNRMIKQRSILASVVYKRGKFYHTRPRKMVLNIRDMSNYCCLCSKHHHTRVSKQNYSRPNEKNANNFTSLIDMPIFVDSLDNKLTTPPPVRKHSNQSPSSSSRKKLSSNQHNNKQDNKVMVSVGDCIRIVPNLEKNQRHATSNNYLDDMLSIYDHQKPTTSKESTNDNNNNNSPKSNNKHNRHHGNKSSRRNRSNLNLKSDASSSKRHQHHSETHTSDNMKQQYNNDNKNATRSNQCVKSLFEDETHNDDNFNDILTLSLDQGHKIKVEMSSSSGTRNTDDQNKFELQSQVQAQPAAVEEFIAANKTLKSIQQITNMILDLSSKASDLDDVDVSDNQLNDNIKASDRTDHSKPNKSIKLAAESDFIDNCPISTKYIAPSAPVHKPKYVLQASRLAGGASEDARFLTQSATTTPLKSLESRASSRRRDRLSSRGRTTNNNRDNNNNNQYTFDNDILPPAPPSMAFSRKLSSRAKSFFDGSFKSLYGGYFSSGLSSDLDSEEDVDPLITNYQRKASLKKRTKTLGYSELNTPAKGNSINNDHFKQTIDQVSLKQKLLKGIGMSSNERDSKNHQHSLSTSQLDKYSDNVVNKSFQTNKNDKKQLEKNLSIYLKSNYNSSDDSGSSFSDSNSSDSDGDIDDNDELNGKVKNALRGIENRFANVKERFAKYSFLSSSVKNLQEFNDKKNKQILNKKGNTSLREQQNLSQIKKRKHRRKPICSNHRCCCAKEFMLHNKPPVWNKLCRVYQLDFGGRVTQESSKNLQIEFGGNLALQFGRIDKCTYTLDYKYPFNAVQAMSIALASITKT